MPGTGETVRDDHAGTTAPAFKAEVALAIRREETSVEVSQQFDVHANQQQNNNREGPMPWGIASL
jgi:hypothetical protein